MRYKNHPYCTGWFLIILSFDLRLGRLLFGLGRGALGRLGLFARRGSGRLGGLFLEARETVDAAAGVHKVLLARVERVALEAQFNLDFGHGRTGLHLIAARKTANLGVRMVLGMDLGLHMDGGKISKKL